MYGNQDGGFRPRGMSGFAPVNVGEEVDVILTKKRVENPRDAARIINSTSVASPVEIV